MLRKYSERIARQERNQRRALILFAAALALLLGFCAFAGVRILTLPPTLIAAGRVEDYTDKQPRRYSVPKLKVSELITRRDSLASEDVIYVRRDNDSGWIALLGVDTLSGCFLYWDAAAGIYTDNNCLGSRYTPDGRYLGGLATGEQPQNMARLPVEVRDGQVFVRDEVQHAR
jgi:Rieske Fe-S protein